MEQDSLEWNEYSDKGAWKVKEAYSEAEHSSMQFEGLGSQGQAKLTKTEN